MTGRVIVVEGIDGVGKTTLSRALAARLDAVWLTTPGPELRPLREAVDDGWRDAPHAQRLFYAASVIAAGRRAARLTREGRDVVVDRYWLTTVAYADAAGVGFDRAALEPLVAPSDATILVDAEDETRAARLAARGTSDGDLWSLRHAEALRRAYERALDGARVGSVLRVDTTDTGVSVVLARVLAWLDGPAARAPQLELFGGRPRALGEASPA